jgi:hypothetical protein
LGVQLPLLLQILQFKHKLTRLRNRKRAVVVGAEHGQLSQILDQSVVESEAAADLGGAVPKGSPARMKASPVLHMSVHRK